MIYQRCAADTYDDWGKENPGWDYAALEPYHNKAEHHINHPSFPTDMAHHGFNGPWKTSIPAYTNVLSKAIIDAGGKVGVPKIADLNDPRTQCGAVRLTTTTDEKGRRSSTAQAYLTKDVRKRRNLTIGVGVTATKVLFENDRAVGVEFAKKQRGKKFTVRARKEVILSTGTITTPHLLMISGIGPKEQLEKQKISVLRDLPGVGKNLTDHLAAGLIYYTKNAVSLEYLKHELKVGPAFVQWAAMGKGPLTSNLAEAALFFRHEDLKKDEPSLDLVAPPNSPDLEILTAPANYLNHALDKVPQKHSLSMGPIHIQPTSRGEITLASSNIWDKPLIDPKYLSTENDRRALLFGMKTAMKMTKESPLKEEIKSSFDFAKPKSFTKFKGKGEFDTFSEADLLDLMKETAFTIYHPTGTAKMGPSSDKNAVVDSELLVHGIKGLRVVDASIMPTIVRGHPQAAVVAIAEKAADMILHAEATEAKVEPSAPVNGNGISEKANGNGTAEAINATALNGATNGHTETSTA